MRPLRPITMFSLASCLALVGCNNTDEPRYDAAAEQIDPALQLYAKDRDAQGPADAVETDENQVMTDNQPSPPPADNDPASPEAMLQAQKVELSDEQWRSILSEQEFDILRRSGTERSFTGRYLNLDEPGSFHCAGCGLYLYDARHKFHSGCGWPSFNQEVAKGALTYIRDTSHGMVRTEMRCARCDGHLGHVFEDAPDQPTGLRHCVNGGALIFVPAGADVARTLREHRAQHANP